MCLAQKENEKMDGSIPIILLLIFILFLIMIITAYKFSSAVQNLNDNELNEIALNYEKSYHKIINVINNPSRFVITIQTITVLEMLIAGFYICDAHTSYIKTLCYAIIFIVVELVLGIMIPKRLGLRKPKKYAVRYVRVISFIMIIFTPLTLVVSVISDLVLMMLGIDPKEPIENVTEEDILSVINEGHEQGVLLASEAEMINNIVEFGDKEAKDIMTHRTGVIALDGEKSLGEISKYIVEQNNSRFPVYIDDIDNIVGIVNFRDIMRESVKEVNNDRKIIDIENLVRDATFIPETKKINLLFKHMQSEKIHMAIVVDEYGQTSGIVAMEDILEEIVGNILDEYDREDAAVVKKEDGSFVVKGTHPLDEIIEETGIKFDEDCETINGYLTSKFGRILSNDERPEIVINNIKYKVLSVENRTIKLVHISFTDNEKVNKA